MSEWDHYSIMMPFQRDRHIHAVEACISAATCDRQEVGLRMLSSNSPSMLISQEVLLHGPIPAMNALGRSKTCA